MGCYFLNSGYLPHKWTKISEPTDLPTGEQIITRRNLRLCAGNAEGEAKQDDRGNRAYRHSPTVRPTARCQPQRLSLTAAAVGCKPFFMFCPYTLFGAMVAQMSWKMLNRLACGN